VIRFDSSLLPSRKFFWRFRLLVSLSIGFFLVCLLRLTSNYVVGKMPDTIRLQQQMHIVDESPLMRSKRLSIKLRKYTSYEQLKINSIRPTCHCTSNITFVNPTHRGHGIAFDYDYRFVGTGLRSLIFYLDCESHSDGSKRVKVIQPIQLLPEVSVSPRALTLHVDETNQADREIDVAYRGAEKSVTLLTSVMPNPHRYVIECQVSRPIREEILNDAFEYSWKVHVSAKIIRDFHQVYRSTILFRFVEKNRNEIASDKLPLTITVD